MKRLAWLITAAAAVVAAATAAVVPRLGADPPDVPTTVVRRNEFRVRITAEGNLSAVRDTPITAPVKTQQDLTVSWIVDDGAVVAEGDVVARFDPSQLEKDRDDGLSDERISGHRIDSAELQREVTADRLELDAEVAGAELDVAREFEATDLELYSRIEIVESRIDTELAATRAEHARASRSIQDSLSAKEIELLAIERRKAEIRVEQAEEGLGALEVRAPHAGIVMLERDWRGNPVRVGDMAWPGRSRAKIPDLGQMQAEVYVLEADAGGLAPGQPATVWLEAAPGTAHPAIVKSVDPMAGRRNRRVPVQYFRAVLALDATDPATMKPGARVHAEIRIADLEHALTVPRQALCSLDGEPVVYRLEKGAFEPVAVTLGPAAVGRVAVLEGLADGDVVALRDPTARGGRGDGGDEGDHSSPVVPGASP
ncbi:MAG TPA: HlyD family efflux transporter periplasmic adaptor subunit [Candidatus Sulfomarinibacteraceae bacterium]|nr:HlyD family efflux transporter periplasmic adaptor subunit [Candidatus Sulfomarinibacteraceae bacterium]